MNVDANAPAKDDEKNLEDKQVMSLIINSSLKTVKKNIQFFSKQSNSDD